jgi:hypothetical protein
MALGSSWLHGFQGWQYSIAEITVQVVGCWHGCLCKKLTKVGRDSPTNDQLILKETPTREVVCLVFFTSTYRNLLSLHFPLRQTPE